MTKGRRLLLLALARTTSRAVALRCRVTSSAVYNWRSGRFIPGPEARKILSDCYGIPPESWRTYTIQGL